MLCAKPLHSGEGIAVVNDVQAATAAVPPGAGARPPQEGDGFTFEHLAGRESIWLDFVADIGDGGDPTYAVACCMAAPTLLATVPPEFGKPLETGAQSFPSLPTINSVDRTSF